MRLGLGTNVFHQTIIVAGPLLLLCMGKHKVKWNIKWKPVDFIFCLFLSFLSLLAQKNGVKYFLTSWANSTFCSSSLSSVCLALLSSNSSLFSVSTLFLSVSALTSSFCSISVRRFCYEGRRQTESGLRIISQASSIYLIYRFIKHLVDYGDEITNCLKLKIIKLHKMQTIKKNLFLQLCFPISKTEAQPSTPKTVSLVSAAKNQHLTLQIKNIAL